VSLANLDQLGIRRVLLEEHHVDERDQQVGSAVFRSEKLSEIKKLLGTTNSIFFNSEISKQK
jgi:hypothetical protein